MLTSCTGSGSGTGIYDLTCENLQQPAGIATRLPRLSWKIRSVENGTFQSAYQIIAASDKDHLTEERADLWNSGKVSSGESILVTWRGKELRSGSPCYWRVRIWDQSGNKSVWSEPSFFSIGLLDDTDWDAEYIGFDAVQDAAISPQMRKTFNLEDIPDHLFIHVNSLGYHEVWVNGKKAGDHVLTPAVSQYNKRSLILTYDISSLVRKGSNDLIIWLGRGWYAPGLPGVVHDGPVVKAQLESTGKDNSRKIILVTDTTWIARASGYSTLGNWQPGRFGGELADGRILLHDLSSRSLNKEVWSAVKIVNIPDHAVTPQMTESNIIADTLRPLSIKGAGDGTWLIDMGTTLTGWFEIRFPDLQKGNEIMMEYSDHLDKDGNIVNQGQTDRYIASGNRDETFMNKFNYHGFRYVRISNLPYEPSKESIVAYLIHTGYKDASSFECSDADMNVIHNMIKYTLRCLSLGGYLVDCPQIERLGYGGDGNASTLTAQTMFDLAPLYSNWLQAWTDCIRDDGGMPHTAPNPYPAGGGPFWCGFIITASWQTYINYGDRKILETNYPDMQKWLGYVDKYSRNGILERWPDTDYRNWYLGDWAVPEGVNQTDTASVILVNNCFLAVCLETMSQIAGVLGKTADVMKYKTEKEILTGRIHKRFFNKEKMIYGSGSQIDLTYPLLAGVVADSLTKAVRANLERVILEEHNGHIACGLVGIPVFTEWSIENDTAGLMYEVLKKRDYPGYLYMIGNGATTTWEHWNGARSRIHNCYNGIGSWFYQALGGIRNDNSLAAYRMIIIDPRMPDGISWAKTRKMTPYGEAEVSWRKENGLVNIRIKVPVGCKASVKIPEKIKAVRLNGMEVNNSSDTLSIESGNYEIEYVIV
jgi:alpha-L-rhamnosidase